MRVTKKALVSQMDKRFIEYLNNAYLKPEKINKISISADVVNRINSNSYHVALPSILIDYNKGLGVARPVPVFDIHDYFVYYFCVKTLEKQLAINRVPNTFGGWSLSGEFRKKESAEAIESDDSPASGLNPAAGAMVYGEFNSKLRDITKHAPKNSTILEIDIANFYDTIRVDRLERQIRSVTKEKQADVVDLLFYFLSNSSKLLHSYRPQTTSIPQDMVGDCSRLLANFYLQSYDSKIYKLCQKYNVEYMRFADDQIFIIPDKIDATMICHEASKYLYQIGLNINQKKVKIWNIKDFESYRCLSVYDIIDVDKTNAEQVPAVCEAFAIEVLGLIRAHYNRRLVNFYIKSEGLPLIKKIIGMGINKLSAKTRKKVLDILYRHDHVVYFQEYNFQKLYTDLNIIERTKLLSYLKLKMATHHHTAFKYEVMKFNRNNHLPWKRIAMNIKMNTNQWRTS